MSSWRPSVAIGVRYSFQRVKPILLLARNPSPMTGPGNNTYLLTAAGATPIRAALIDAGVGEPQHLAELEAALDERDARLDTVLVTHGHRDHAAGAPAIAAAHPSAAFTKYPWPEEDRQYGVPWQTLRDGDVVVAGEEPLIALHTPGH